MDKMGCGQRTSKKTIIIAIINVLVISGALIGAYFVFYTPEKRLERSLNRAEEALQDKDYDAAYDEYKKALDIDGDSIAARYGLLRLYAEEGRKTELRNAFEESVIFIRGLDETAFNENKDELVQIYMYAGIVYEKNPDKRIAVYEEANKRTQGNEFIVEKLLEDYFDKSEYFAALGDIYNEVDCYNKILDIAPDNDLAAESRRSTITQRLEELIGKEEYDEADEIIDKFSDIDPSVDFEGYSAEVSEKRNVHNAKYELMASVYDLMAAKDYEAMMEVDGTANANFVGTHVDDSFVYTPHEGEVQNYTGTAAGIFKFKETAYYFYYGDFVDGKCSGNGVMFLLTDADHKSYYLYDGEWNDNKPEGKGTVYAVHEYDKATDTYSTREESGNFTAGLQNGRMKGRVILNDKEIYTGSWKTAKGVPRDVSSRYADYPFSVPDGKVMYAVFLNEDGSVGWGSWVSSNGHLGVIPFVN